MGKFSSCKHYIALGEKQYCVRILEMNGSTLIFLCDAKKECVDDLAVAMPIEPSGQIISTNIFAKELISNSQCLAEKLSKRFKRQIFISYNANVDPTIVPQLEKLLNECINKQF